MGFFGIDQFGDRKLANLIGRSECAVRRGEVARSTVDHRYSRVSRTNRIVPCERGARGVSRTV